MSNKSIKTLAKPDSIIKGLPNICGHEEDVELATSSNSPIFQSNADALQGVRAAFALALHMHQPTISAGGDALEKASLINNLQYMFEHQSEGDNHNASVFEQCYTRIADFIRQLVDEGKSPRIMLDYSGNLLWGLDQMDKRYVLDNLSTVTVDPKYRKHVEWLGTMWSHALPSSTPVPDLKLHMRAWQHHFASIFGFEALSRVKGFSPPEMHMPNHPDVVYAYIKALQDCGYKWLLVQEHTVEEPDGSALRQKHLPRKLLARNIAGDTISITALIKTQGSDTKLVAQIQPLSEARGLQRLELDGKSVPQFVVQVGDGENGGVMMNEFPRDYMEKMRQLPADVPTFNGTEYLELIEALGVNPDHYPVIQPVHQAKLWSKYHGGGTDALTHAIEACKKEDSRFHMDGGSWTDNISWTSGYENVLDPMNQFSAHFHEVVDGKVSDGKISDTNDHRYRNALTHLLLSQTSCFRYWGQGRWTDYGKEICRRGMAILSDWE